MPDYFDIYQNHAGQYDLLVEREDFQHHLLEALKEITSINGLDVVEFGAGTGRLTCMLAPLVESIRAFDSSQPMLDVAVEKLKRMEAQNWQVAVGDHRNIPSASASADLVISGWSMCYLALVDDRDWKMELNRGLQEMKRIARKNGTLVIIETLGTGHETPIHPKELIHYFDFLEGSGFQRTWIRTDYRFTSMEEAQNLSRFFFGNAMVQQIKRSEAGIILPECTGIWWQNILSKETDR